MSTNLGEAQCPLRSILFVSAKVAGAKSRYGRRYALIEQTLCLGLDRGVRRGVALYLSQL